MEPFAQYIVKYHIGLSQYLTASALKSGEWSPLLPGRFTPGAECLEGCGWVGGGDWVGLRNCVKPVVKGKMFFVPAGNQILTVKLVVSCTVFS
jgi:hypothetical protein